MATLRHGSGGSFGPPIYFPFPECWVMRWILRSMPDLNVRPHLVHVTVPAISVS